MRVSGRSLSHSPPQFQWLIVLLTTAARERKREREREERPERQQQRGRKEGRGQSHKVRAMSTLLFPLLRSVSRCSCQRGQAENSGGPAETDVLTESTCTGRLSLKDVVPNFPLFGWNKDGEGSSRRRAANVNRIRYTQISILIRSFHCILMWDSRQHGKVVNSSTYPPLLYYVKLPQTCHIIDFQVVPGHSFR